MGSFLTTAMIMFISAQALMAQESSPESDTPQTDNSGAEQIKSLTRKNEIVRMAEQDARYIIEWLIPADSFEVVVKTQIKQINRPNNLFVPDTMTTVIPSIMGSWIPYADSVSIEVRIDKRFGRSTRSEILDLLSSKLDIPQNSISFRTLNIERKPERSDLELQVQKAEADTRDAKNQASQILREREDAKRDLSIVKSDLDKAGREAAALKAQVEAAEKAKSASSEQKDAATNAPDSSILGLSKDQVFFVILGFVGLLFFAVIYMAMSVRSTGRSLSEALMSIGSSIPVLGDKLIEASAGRGDALAEGDGGSKKLNEAPSDLPALNAGSSLAGMPLESIHARLVSLHSELTQSINSSNDYVIVRHLTSLLKNSELVGKAVVSMEILGKDIANKLYQRLGSDDQEKISNFLEHGIHKRSKWEVMLEAGEELKTRILSSGMTGLRGKVNEKVAERIMKFKTEDLLMLAGKLEFSAIPRLFLYLEANQLAEFLTRSKIKDAEQFKRYATSVPRVAAAMGQPGLDQEIAKALDSFSATMKDDAQRPFLAYYKQLIESVDDNVAEVLTSTLARDGGHTVDTFIQENIVTFAAFFRIALVHRESILESLSNKEIAVLMWGLERESRVAVKAVIA